MSSGGWVKIGIWVSFIIGTQSSRAQNLSQDSVLSDRDSTRLKSGFILQLTSQNFLVGNALNVDFFRTFLQGGSWRANQNQRVLDHLSFSNLSFYQSKSEFSFTEARNDKVSENAWNLRFHLGDQQYGHIRFSGDLYRLAINGNSQYLGDTLYIGQNDGERQHYRYYGIGVASAGVFDFCMISYVDGLNYNKVLWNPGTFYTSSFGDSIAVDANVHQWISSSDRKGVGFKLDARKSFIGRKVNLTLDLLDLGWIKWNDLQKDHWRIDETYTGVQWIDWIKVNDPLTQNLNRWSSSEKELSSKWVALPTSIKMQVNWKVIKNWSIDFSSQRWVYQQKQGFRCVSIQRSWERFSLTRPDVHWRISAYQSLARQYWIGSDVSWSWLNGCSVQLQTFQLFSPMIKASKQIGFSLGFQYVFKGLGKEISTLPIDKLKDEQQYFQF